MELQPTPPWPAAKQGDPRLVAHPAWEEARNAILDLASEGPITVALIGPPGSGKTCLLRELAGSLGDYGFPTMVLLQGNLPAFLTDGAALLVDHALGMPEAVLDQLLVQRRGVAILADVERFGEIVLDRSPEPVVVALRPLDSAEMSDFIDEWLTKSGFTSAVLDPVTRARLVERTQGSVGRAVHLLATAVTAAPHVSTPPPQPPAPRPATTAPTLTVPGIVPRSAPQPQPLAAGRPGPQRRATGRVVMAGTALAACFALTWAVGTRLSQTETATVLATPASFPPLRPADVPAPMLASHGPPPAANTPGPVAQAAATPPPVVPAAPPAVAPADVAFSPDIMPSSVRVATDAAPEATDAALLSEQVSPAVPTSATNPAPSAAYFPAVRSHLQRGGVGMVLLARRGDTLESMYRAMYRDRSAPPYADVVAANPHPLKPGAIVVFPAPTDGWSARARDDSSSFQR